MTLPVASPGPKSIWVFLGLTFSLSWPFLIYGFGWFSVERAPLNRYLFSCAGMLMVSLSAFLTRALVERKGFADVGWNRASAGTYFRILAFNAALWLLPALVALVFGQLEWNLHLTSEEWAVVALSLGGFSLLAGFGEEFGWRGYLLPRLLTEARLVRRVLLLLGVIWGIWHCAVALGPLLKASLEGGGSLAPIARSTVVQCLEMIGSSIALSVIFGSVWLRTRSIFVSSFFHGTWLGIRDAAAHLLHYPPAFGGITVALVLIAWFAADRWLRDYLRQEVPAIPE
jgi:membrane protease YdiL (CAAX protease family)